MLRKFARHSRESVTSNASAFGYSVGITGSFAMIDSRTEATDPHHILLFVVGAALAFPAIEAVASSGFRRTLREADRDVEIIGASFSVFAIALAVVTAWLITLLLPTELAWLLASFGATVAYVVGDALQMGLAKWAEGLIRRRTKRGGREGERG